MLLLILETRETII